MPFAQGENVGPYRIIEQMGQGGMATVFKAYHPSLDRFVAMKVMHPAFKQDSTFLARFQREARVVAKLEHPNIVPVYDYAEHNGNPYLVMKFIEGETLKARLARGPLTRQEGLRIVEAVGKALAYAHSRGILHRDIKPSNILLTPEGSVYLADFGLARIAQAGESTLSSEMLLGTPHYISPEQARGERNLDAGTDIYSFGVVLYEMVVGRVPFNADTPFSIIHDHIFTPLPLPQKINPNVPDAVQRVLLKALAKERGDRYATVDEMVSAFLKAVTPSEPAAGSVDAAETLVGTPLAPAPPSAEPVAVAAAAEAPAPGPEAQPAKPPRSRRWWWIVGGAVITCLCLFGFLLLARDQGLGKGGAQPPASAQAPLGQNPGNLTQPPIGTQASAGGPEVQSKDPGLLAARATAAANPDDPAAHMALGLAEANAGFNLAASREFRKAGDLFMRAGAFIEAAEAYLRAVEQSGAPEEADPQLLDSATRACYFAAPDPRMVDLLDRVSAGYPDWQPLPSLQARAFLAQGDLPRSKELIDKALQRDPKDPLALAVQAEWLQKTGDLAGARKTAETARATPNLQPWLANALDSLLKGMKP